MVTISDAIQTIRNTACIICGAAFKAPRARKFYCSPKCKQFGYYHKSEIMSLKEANKGISEQAHELSLREYDKYLEMVKRIREYRDLKHRETSKYSPLDESHKARLEALEKELPGYLKSLNMPRLSLEKWSFIKLLYPGSKKDNFFRLVDSLSSEFLSLLTYQEKEKKLDSERNSITNLFRNHIFKIANGQIKFSK